MSRRLLGALALSFSLAFLGCTGIPTGGNPNGGVVTDDEQFAPPTLEELRALLAEVNEVFLGVHAIRVRPDFLGPEYPRLEYRIAATPYTSDWEGPEELDNGAQKWVYSSPEDSYEEVSATLILGPGPDEVIREEVVTKSPVRPLGTYTTQGVSTYAPEAEGPVKVDLTTTFVSSEGKRTHTYRVTFDYDYTEGNTEPSDVRLTGTLPLGVAVDFRMQQSSGEDRFGFDFTGSFETPSGKAIRFSSETVSKWHDQGENTVTENHGGMELILPGDLSLAIIAEVTSTSDPEIPPTMKFEGALRDKGGQTLAVLTFGEVPDDRSQPPPVTITFTGQEPEDFDLSFMESLNAATQVLMLNHHTVYM